MFKQLAMATTMIATALGATAAENAPLIDKPAFTAPADGIFNIEALEALGRVSDPQVSPDGSKVLYGVSYESVEQNKSNNDLYLIDLKEAGRSIQRALLSLAGEDPALPPAKAMPAGSTEDAASPSSIPTETRSDSFGSWMPTARTAFR